MKIDILENKRILFLGLGLTNFESAQALEQYKDKIIIVEKNINTNNYVSSLKDMGYDIRQEEELLNSELEFDLILKSPGIPLENKILKKYKNLEVINDIELAYLYIKQAKLNTKIVAITATNGKTSTTLYIEKFLKNASFKVQSAGNIGISPLTILKTQKDLDFLVLEISSFQLLDINKFRADYSFILNITPDHLNIHHSFENYTDAKIKITKNQNMDNYLFTKKKVYDNFLKKRNLNTNIILNEVSEQVVRNINFYKYTGMNFNNLLLCYKFGKILNIESKYFYKTLNEFEGLEHRVEFVDCVCDINFYNDSKATNLEATKESLKHLDNIILLVGGRSEPGDLEGFDDYLKNVKTVICFGENKEYFKSPKIKDRVKTLEEAVALAKKFAQVGDSILLSPASKSFDQYKSYKVRGHHFKRLIKEIW